MFNIPDFLTSYWDRHPKPKATIRDIQNLEIQLGISLPTPYIEFITQFGFVLFGHDKFRGCSFEYKLIFSGRIEKQEGNISGLRNTEQIWTAYQISTTHDENDDRTPFYPKNYIPIGNSAGQDRILLDATEKSGSIWYWRDSYDAWGTGENTQLGFVADNFYDFINNLRPNI